jgi:hypothetical protein
MKTIPVPDDQWQKAEDRISDAYMSPGLTEEDFLTEFESVSDQLKTALGQHWSEDDQEFTFQFEFFLVFCRVVAIGMFSPRTFCQEFFSTIQGVLDKQPTSWAVHISAEPEELLYHELHWTLIFVEKDIIHFQKDESGAYPSLIEATLKQREHELTQCTVSSHKR